MAVAKRRKTSASRKSTKGSGKTIAQYVSSLTAERRKEFSQQQEMVSKALPEARLTMPYGMPTWEIGEPVCAAASQKHYLSLYMCELGSLDKYRKAFSHLDVGKCYIRFKAMEQLPLPVVKKMLREAAKQTAKGPGQGR